jgi:hypothetical protein
MNPSHLLNQRWLEHFRRNRSALAPIPWNHGPDLSERARATISTSIQSFQLGESSEGRHLLRYAREWEARSGDSGYVEAIQSLISEEGRHAGDLGRFMGLNGIPRRRRGWTDSVFRRLRNVVGTLEISIGVLVTAEIIAKVYYQALHGASDSLVLRAICDQIIGDEYKHVEFSDGTARTSSNRTSATAIALDATPALAALHRYRGSRRLVAPVGFLRRRIIDTTLLEGVFGRVRA